MKSNKKFEEESIRPACMRTKLEKYTQDDAKWLKEKKDRFVEVACPSCHDFSYSTIYYKRGFHFVRCGKCEMVFVTPRPSATLLDEFYKHSRAYSYLSNHLYPATASGRRENVILPRVKNVLNACQRHCLNMGTLVEVGAGYGTFCHEILSMKVFEKVIAIEPNIDLSLSCRDLGITTINKSFEEVDKLQADLVVCFEVIEHVFSPSSFLKAIHNLLRPGGMAYLTCPNCNGFDLMTLGPLSDQVDFEHLNYFHPKSIAALVEYQGFAVVEICTPGQLDVELVRKNMMENKSLREDHPFLSHMMLHGSEKLHEEFQELLQRHNLSSHMSILIKRL